MRLVLCPSILVGLDIRPKRARSMVPIVVWAFALIAFLRLKNLLPQQLPQRNQRWWPTLLNDDFYDDSICFSGIACVEGGSASTSPFEGRSTDIPPASSDPARDYHDDSDRSRLRLQQPRRPRRLRIWTCFLNELLHALNEMLSRSNYCLEWSHDPLRT